MRFQIYALHCLAMPAVPTVICKLKHSAVSVLSSPQGTVRRSQFRSLGLTRLSVKGDSTSSDPGTTSVNAGIRCASKSFQDAKALPMPDLLQLSEADNTRLVVQLIVITQILMTLCHHAITPTEKSSRNEDEVCVSGKQTDVEERPAHAVRLPASTIDACKRTAAETEMRLL